MKRVFIAVLMAGVLSVCYSTSTQAQSISDRNLIVTEGIGEVTGKNDSARISIAVVTDGRILEQISSENAGKTKAVLTAIKGLKINNLELETSNFRVTPQKDYKARPPKIKGYEVHNTIKVTLEGFGAEDLSRHVSTVVGKALESGANDIHHIQFYIKDKRPLEKEALTQATQEAVERARTLAKAAGVKLKRIASLSTRPMQVPPVPHTFRAAEMKAQDAAGAPPIEIGESRVRVQVTVAYEME